MSAPVTARVVRPDAHVALTCLAPAERTAAERLGTPAARHRHLRSRAVLRQLVADVTGTAAADVRLVAPLGMPPAVAGPSAPGVSLAHADGTVAAAACRSGTVGVDVEVAGSRHRPVPAAVLNHERLALAAGLVGQELASLAVWVLLEAALKAVGTGFGIPQRQVGFAPAPDGVWLDVPGHGRHGGVVRVLPGGVVLAVATPRALPELRVVDALVTRAPRGSALVG